jgi:hypothetical protein
MLKNLWPHVTALRRTGRVYHLVALCVLVLLVLIPSGVAYAGNGSIQSLTATSAPHPGDTFTVTAILHAQGKVKDSNLYYQIIAPDGHTVVLTHTTDLPTLQNETYTDSWSADNNGFPSMGNYTVVLCWSDGDSQNCDIASASTTFYSAPTLGLWFGLAALGAVGVFVWRRRADFAPREQML